MKLRYEFSPDKVQRDIRWLEVVEGDGGAFVLQYEDINAPCKWDNFFASVDEALSACEEDFGVSRLEWHEVT